MTHSHFLNSCTARNEVSSAEPVVRGLLRLRGGAALSHPEASRDGVAHPRFFTGFLREP
jgi:hypothetical protein